MDKIKLHPITLAFTGVQSHLESEFIDDYHIKQLSRARMGLLLGLLLFAIFGILDYILIKEMAYNILILRFFVVCPIVLLMFILTYTKIYKKVGQAIHIITIILGGIGITFMIYIIPAPSNQYYYAGILLVVMFGYVLLPIRFIYATVICWPIIFLYEYIAIYQIELSWELIINNNFFLLSGSILGMISNYGIEKSARLYFFQNIILKENQQELIHSSKMATVGTLVAGVAHVINNPMAIISGNMQILNLQINKNGISKESFNKRYGQISLAIDRIADVVSGLKIFIQNVTCKEELVNYHKIILDMLKITRDMYDSENIQIIDELNAESSIVLGCNQQFQQVIMNLITNAKEAYDKNSGTIKIKTFNDNNKFILTVNDEGKGISEFDQAHIFDAFYSNKDPGKRTGLGLSISKSIIETYKGTLEVMSKENIGSTFIVSLPLT